ncbi:MAG: hypothetical protein ACRDGS_09960, partial [Chloroflexota bacterium]
ITAEELRESIREGRLLPQGPDVPPERTLHLDWRLMRLRPEEAIALGQRLSDLVHEYDIINKDPGEGEDEIYRMLLAIFPTAPRGNQPGR